MVIFFSGCVSTGLSARETGMYNYSNFIYGLYGEPSQSTNDAKPIKLPMKLAVAQVGESAPPRSMLAELSGRSLLIAEAIPLPAGGPLPGYYGQKPEDQESFEKKMEKMRSLAQDLGADHIFLFGGNADLSDKQGWLGFWDMTVVGMFVVPSHRLETQGRASGALIDVGTGKVLTVVSSQKDLAAYATTCSLDGRRDEVLLEVRDALSDGLAKELTRKLDALAARN